MLPIIDFSPFLADGAAGRDRVAGAIGEACEATGFFHLRQHGVPQPVIDSALRASRRFFALPEPVKRRSGRQPGRYRGYIATQPFSRDRTSGEEFQYEAFIVGEETVLEDPACKASGGLYSPNLWPAEPAGFRPAVQAYWQALTRLSQQLLGALSMALGQPEDLLGRYFSRPLSNISLLHYPPRPPSGSGGGEDANAHYDTDVVTILLPGETGGLQVMHRDGDWLEVDPLPGCFVVNIGNMLELWSGGRFRSTMHRVHPPVGRERYSIAYFTFPDYDTLVEPLSGLPAADIPGKPLSVHAGEDLARFVAGVDTARGR